MRYRAVAKQVALDWVACKEGEKIVAYEADFTGAEGAISKIRFSFRSFGIGIKIKKTGENSWHFRVEDFISRMNLEKKFLSPENNGIKNDVPSR